MKIYVIVSLPCKYCVSSLLPTKKIILVIIIIKQIQYGVIVQLSSLHHFQNFDHHIRPFLFHPQSTNHSRPFQIYESKNGIYRTQAYSKLYHTFVSFTISTSSKTPKIALSPLSHPATSNLATGQHRGKTQQCRKSNRVLFLFLLTSTIV